MNLNIWEFFQNIFLPILLTYFIYNERDKRNMKSVIARKIPKTEVEKIIELKLESTKVEIREIKDDLKRIESKLDRLLEKLMK